MSVLWFHSDDEEGIAGEAAYAAQRVKKLFVGALADNEQACAMDVAHRATLSRSIDAAPRILMCLRDSDRICASTTPGCYLPTPVRGKPSN